MNDTVVISGETSIISQIDGKCSMSSQLSGTAMSVLPINDFTYYTGEYVVTPSDEVITLNTTQLMMSENVTINPVPSNYGLITWNGSTLTVS